MKVSTILIALQLLMVNSGLCGEQNILNDHEKQLFEDVKKDYVLSDAQTYEVFGMTLLDKDLAERASLCFEQAVKLDSTLYMSWYLLGLCNMDSPEHYFKKTIEANPDFALSYYWLGMYYRHEHKDGEARQCFNGYLSKVDNKDTNEKGRIKTARKIIQDHKAELSDEEIEKRCDKLDTINEKLQNRLSDDKRSKLLFEKSQLMFETFGQMYLRTATEALLKAIQINPKKKYKSYLQEVYTLYWKDRDFSGDDQVSKDLTALKERCKTTLRK